MHRCFRKRLDQLPVRNKRCSQASDLDDLSRLMELLALEVVSERLQFW